MNTGTVRLRLVILLGLCALLCMDCTAARPAKKPAGEISASPASTRGADTAAPSLTIAGTWKSAMFGVMKLKQSGTKVSGTYEYNDGQLKGAIEGNRFTYQWWEHVPDQPYERAFESHRGDGYFTISPDGRKLDGKWRYEGTEEWGGNWTFRKLK